MKLHADLREFVELLNAHSVDFLVVGGHAVAFHGYPRFTGDIDLLIRRSSDNADRVLRALAEFGFGDVGITAEDLEHPETVVQLGHPPNRIDLLTSISGVGFGDLWSTRVGGVLDGVPVSFPSRALLIANKRASARAKDIADAEALDAVAALDADRDS